MTITLLCCSPACYSSLFTPLFHKHINDPPACHDDDGIRSWLRSVRRCLGNRIDRPIPRMFSPTATSFLRQTNTISSSSSPHNTPRQGVVKSKTTPSKKKLSIFYYSFCNSRLGIKLPFFRTLFCFLPIQAPLFCLLKIQDSTHTKPTHWPVVAFAAHQH